MSEPINTQKIVDYVFWIILVIFLIFIMIYILSPRMFKQTGTIVPTESMVSAESTERTFTNGTLEQRDFPPSQCFDGNKTTYCQSLKRRFPTYSVNLGRPYNITRLVIYNHPEPDKRELTPLMVIVENESRIPVFRHLVEETEEEPHEIPIDINSRGQYLIFQISSMKAVQFKMSDLEIYFRV
jgi:hypothetical protein